MTTAALGRLVVSLEANIAQFTNDMNRAVGVTERSMQSIARAADLAKTVLAGFGAALSVGAVVTFTRDVINAASALDDLSDVTGSTVEDLSRLNNIAKVSGQSFDDFQTALTKLATKLGNSDDESKKATEALRLLGVTSKDPAKALEELAFALDKYADGANKAALLADIFGKGGASLNAVLKDIVKNADVQATVTAQQAAEAERLNQSWERLALQGTVVKNVILSEIVPALATAIDTFNTLRKAGEGAFSAFDAAVTGLSVEQIIAQKFDKIAQLEKELADSAKPPTSFLDSFFYKDPQEIRAKLAPLYAELERLRRARGLTTEFDFGPPTIKGEAPQTGNKGGGGTTREKIDEYARLLDQLRQSAAQADAQLQALFSGEKLTAADRQLASLTSSEKWKTFTEAQQKAIISLVQGTSETERQAQKWEELGKAAASFAEEQRKQTEEHAKQIAQGAQIFDEFIARIQLEADTMGLSSIERERYIAKLQLESDNAKGLITSYDEYIERLNRINQAFNNLQIKTDLEEQRKAIEEQAKEFERSSQSLTSTIADALIRAFDGGKNAAQSLADSVKAIFRNLVLKPTIEAVFAPLGAGLTSLIGGIGSASANPLGGGGGSGLLGLLGGSGGGLLSGLGDLIFGGGGGAAFGAGLSSPLSTLSQLASILSGGGEFASAGLAAASGIGALVPVVGAALSIASLFGAFSKDPSKVRGQFGISSGVGGFEDNAFTSSRFGNLGFLDAGTQQFSGQAGKVFTDALGKLLDSIATRLTPEQVSRVTGRLQSQQFAGKEGTFTTEDFLRQYGGDILRGVLGTALSELDERFGPLIADFQGTAEEVETFATRLVNLHDNIEALNTILTEGPSKAVDAALNTSAYDAFIRQGEALDSLVDSFDYSLDATEALSSATTDYYKSLVSLLVQIKQVSKAVSQMFATTTENILLAGQTPEFQYNYFRQQADSELSRISTLTDPQAIQEAASRINDLINRALSVLTPEQISLMRGSLLDFTRAVDATVQGRLGTIGNNATSAANSDIETVKGLLNAAVDKMLAAANKQDAAGDKALVAANTPIRVEATVVLNGSQVNG